MTHNDPDQAWFWTPQWQAGEAEASAEIAASGLTVYDDMGALFADMPAFRDALIGGTGQGKSVAPWIYLVEEAGLLVGGMPGQGKSAALRAGAVRDAVEGTEGGAGR
ncbi:hypothetical protein BBK14_13605 [Parafrankia soli]|uniref:Uncharacterized protein n=1 Tax=Parafrankia soli TaxID=2599596 RepID=A0A1S1R314_9ACTN|nr:hypothetical protein [Parafrankia soli]OHV39702.1 hypothetical protein BBK14_13605 [Parafrankia soli]